MVFELKKEVIEKWKSMHITKDLKAIQVKIKGKKPSTSTIRRCIFEGKFTSMETVKAVKKFYSDRQKQLDKINLV